MALSTFSCNLYFICKLIKVILKNSAFLCVCEWIVDFFFLPPKSHGEFKKNDEMKSKWVIASSQPNSPK